MYTDTFNSVKGLLYYATIYVAELYGVLKAVEYILEIRAPRSVVFVDSQSVISGILSITCSKNSLVDHARAKILLTLELGLLCRVLPGPPPRVN